jgi:iron complex transport system substrate-binding protein
MVASARWTPALPPSVVAPRAGTISQVSPGPYPKVTTGPLGGRVLIRAQPRRIVSLALSVDEILIDLVAPERIAAFTVFVDDPWASTASAFAPKGVPRVTGEPESLLALEPDLVITSGYTRPEALSLVEASGVPVVGTGSPTTFGEVLDAVMTVGEAVGEPERARSLVATTKARIDAVASRPHGRRRRVLLWDGGFTYGGGTLEDEIVRLAGGKNVASALRGASALTEEAAIALDPEVVVVPVRGPQVECNAPGLLGADDLWSAVDAVRQGHVHGIPRAWVGSVSHHAVRALEAMASIIDRTVP